MRCFIPLAVRRDGDICRQPSGTEEASGSLWTLDDRLHTVYGIVAKQPHETPEEAIVRVHGDDFFDATAGSWEPPVDNGPWQSAWRETVVAQLVTVHAWSRKDDDNTTVLGAQDYAWQVEVAAGSAGLRHRRQWTGLPGSPLDASVLEVFARAGSVLLTPDQDQWFDLAEANAPRELD